MLSRTNQMLIGIVVIFALVIGLYLIYRSSQPSEMEIADKINLLDIKPIDKNIIDDNLEAQLNQKAVHGNIPVDIDQSEQGRENPFNDI